jgi:hypothetical protein
MFKKVAKRKGTNFFAFSAVDLQNVTLLYAFQQGIAQS